MSAAFRALGTEQHLVLSKVHFDAGIGVFAALEADDEGALGKVLKLQVFHLKWRLFHSLILPRKNPCH
jgi:hypothetical protein